MLSIIGGKARQQQIQVQRIFANQAKNYDHEFQRVFS